MLTNLMNVKNELQVEELIQGTCYQHASLCLVFSLGQ